MSADEIRGLYISPKTDEYGNTYMEGIHRE
mgnify:CR=1 FL=1